MILDSQAKRRFHREQENKTEPNFSTQRVNDWTCAGGGGGGKGRVFWGRRIQPLLEHQEERKRRRRGTNGQSSWAGEREEVRTPWVKNKPGTKGFGQVLVVPTRGGHTASLAYAKTNIRGAALGKT